MTKTISQLSNPHRNKVVILATLAFLSVLSPTGTYAHCIDDATPRSPQITVTATGESQAAPDMAVIDLAVVTRGKTAQKALEDNNKSVNNIVKMFKNNGVQENDVQTKGLFIRHSNPDQQKEEGNNEDIYRVSNYLTVRVRSLPNAGKIFDQAVALGANSISGIIFTNDDTKPFYKEAREKAIAEAIEQAKTLAQAANVKLGKITDIYEVNTSPRRTMYLARNSGDENEMDTNFFNGEIDYNVVINVSFAID